MCKPRFFHRIDALGLGRGEALSVDQVKRAEPGSPSNGETEFAITKSHQF